MPSVLWRRLQSFSLPVASSGRAGRDMAAGTQPGMRRAPPFFYFKSWFQGEPIRQDFFFFKSLYSRRAYPPGLLFFYKLVVKASLSVCTV